MAETVRILWPVIDLYKGDNQFIGIMIISSLLEQSGYRSEVVEADFRKIRAKLIPDIPTIVAYSTPTIFARTYLELNDKLKKEFRILSVFGGPHPTYFPEMIEEEGVDGICRGEGEYAMLDLVKSFAAGKKITGIQNWWIKENGKIHQNNVRPLVQDLDQLPLPDHGIFRKAIPHGIWHAFVLTSRGCPYNCTYCYNHVFRELYKGKGKVIRRRSVDNVMEELVSIKQHECYKFIRFLDDLFTLSPEWVEEFCERYKREIRLPFSCLVRANHVTPSVIRNLKQAGCWRIQMGIESGDEIVRNEIFERNMSEQQILDAAKIIKNEGIKLVTGNIIGNPGGSLETDLKTLELNIRIRPDVANASLLHPYPKTKIHSYALKLGMLESENLNMRESTASLTSSLKFKDKKEKERIENLQKFFALTVEFPRILPLVKKLINLRSNRIFDFVLARWVNYSLYFRTIPPSLGWRTIWKRLKIYSRIMRLYHRLIRGRSC